MAFAEQQYDSNVTQATEVAQAYHSLDRILQKPKWMIPLQLEKMCFLR